MSAPAKKRKRVTAPEPDEEYIPKFIRDVKRKTPASRFDPRIIRTAEWFKDRYGGLTEAERKKIKQEKEIPPAFLWTVKQANGWRHTVPLTTLYPQPNDTLPVAWNDDGEPVVFVGNPDRVATSAFEDKTIGRRKVKSVDQKLYDLDFNKLDPSEIARLRSYGPLTFRDFREAISSYPSLSEQLAAYSEADGHYLSAREVHSYINALNAMAESNIIPGSDRLFFCTTDRVTYSDIDISPDITLGWENHDCIVMATVIYPHVINRDLHAALYPDAFNRDGSVNPDTITNHYLLIVFDKRTNDENPKKRIIVYDQSSILGNEPYGRIDQDIPSLVRFFRQQRAGVAADCPGDLNSIPDFDEIGYLPGSFLEEPDDWEFSLRNNQVAYQRAINHFYIGGDCTIFTVWFMFWYLLNPYISLVEAPPMLVNNQPALFEKFVELLAYAWDKKEEYAMDVRGFAEVIFTLLEHSEWGKFIGAGKIKKARKKRK